jgi:hypothetical protein
MAAARSSPNHYRRDHEEQIEPLDKRGVRNPRSLPHQAIVVLFGYGSFLYTVRGHSAAEHVEHGQDTPVAPAAGLPA